MVRNHAQHIPTHMCAGVLSIYHGIHRNPNSYTPADTPSLCIRSLCTVTPKWGVLKVFWTLRLGHIQLSVGSRGVAYGVHFGGILSLSITPTRARAYNDLHKDAVLLKTASNGVSYPQNGSILGSRDARIDGGICYTRISLYPW